LHQKRAGCYTPTGPLWRRDQEERLRYRLPRVSMRGGVGTKKNISASGSGRSEGDKKFTRGGEGKVDLQIRRGL